MLPTVAVDAESATVVIVELHQLARAAGRQGLAIEWRDHCRRRGRGGVAQHGRETQTVKTQIIYTITLVNSDGSKATASTPALEYPATPSPQLEANAQQTVKDLAQSHTAMTAAIKAAMKDGATPAGKTVYAVGRR